MLDIGPNIWMPCIVGGEAEPPGTTVSAIFPEFGAEIEAVRRAPATVASSFPEFTASVEAELVEASSDTDLVVLTRFSTLSSNFPSTPGTAAVRCWGGGGGGTAATGSGGSGAYAELTAYAYSANEAFTLSVGAGGASGGGTGGDTTFQSTACVAKGAVGATGGLSASSVGDVVRAGLNGSAGGANTTGAPSHGADTAASGGAAGEWNGAISNIGTTTGASRAPGTGGGSTSGAARAGGAGMGMLEYTEPSGGVYPDLVGYEVTRSVGTSHPAAVPAGDVGDLLVTLVGSDGNATITCGSDDSICTSTSGTTITGNAFERVAAGGDTITVTTSASEEVIIIVLRFRHAGAPTGTATNATGANADPPTHTPVAGSAPYRWLTVAIVNSGTADGVITARPTNYDKSIYIPTRIVAGGLAMCVAWRDNTAASENPGAWTSAGDNVTMTISVPRV